MKKTYETPTAKLFDISLEEKIASSCTGFSIFDFATMGCNTTLRAKGGSCVFGEAGSN